MQSMITRCAGIHVHQATIVVTVRVPDEGAVGSTRRRRSRR
jgi:hypothetical protein